MKDKDIRKYRLMEVSKLNEIWCANQNHLCYYLDRIQMISNNDGIWKATHQKELARCHKKASIIFERLEFLEGILKQSYRYSDEMNY